MTAALVASLIAAAVAAGASAYSEYKKSEAADKAKQEAEKNVKKAEQEAADIKQKVQQHNETVNGYGTAQDVTDYAKAARSTDFKKMYTDFWDKNGDGVVDENDVDEFTYDKQVSDFYNPNRERLLGAVTKQLQGTAGGSGMAHSTYGLESIASGVADKNEQLYANALSQYNTDRNQAYQSWNDYLTQRRAQYDNLVGATNSNLSNMKGLADSYLEEQQNEFSDLMNAIIAGQNMTQAARNTAAQTGNYTADYGSSAAAGANAFGTVYTATAPTNKNAF